MILLDTNALIILAEGRKVRPAALAVIAPAMDRHQLAISATAAWEIGLLATKTGRTAAIFRGDGRAWFARAVAGARLRIIPFDSVMALEAAYLPHGCPNDPVDRWTIAVARVLGVPLVTSDRAILAYAARGYLDAIPL